MVKVGVVIFHKYTFWEWKMWQRVKIKSSSTINWILGTISFCCRVSIGTSSTRSLLAKSHVENVSVPHPFVNKTVRKTKRNYVFDVNVIKPCITIAYNIWLKHKSNQTVTILGAGNKSLLTIISFFYCSIKLLCCWQNISRAL